MKPWTPAAVAASKSEMRLGEMGRVRRFIARRRFNWFDVTAFTVCSAAFGHSGHGSWVPWVITICCAVAAVVIEGNAYRQDRP